MTAGTTDGLLYPPERQEAILHIAQEQGRVEVAALAEAFQVTTETVRRDLTVLQQRRLLHRVHGGAILWDHDRFEPLLAKRKTQHVDEKRRIALAVVEELPPDGIVLLDSGSTLARVASHLPAGRSLTVVTNSILNVQLLTDHDDAEVVVLGGAYDKATLTAVDSQTVAQVQQLRVDVVILGTDGISPDGGLTTPYRNQAELKRAMIAAARRVIVAADSSKIPHDHFIRFAACQDVDTLITDDGLDDATTQRFEEIGLRVVRT